jgi:hypothetical protein
MGVHDAGQAACVYPSELDRTVVNCNPNCNPDFGSIIHGSSMAWRVPWAGRQKVLGIPGDPGKSNLVGVVRRVAYQNLVSHRVTLRTLVTCLAGLLLQ